MTNKFFQNIIYQMQDALDRPVGMIDESGFIISYSDTRALEKHVGEITKLSSESNKPFTRFGYTFYSPFSFPQTGYTVFVLGEDEEAARYTHVLSISLGGLKQLHDEKSDKTNLIKNILLDNVLPDDIMARSKELRLSYDTPRVVLLIRMVGHTDLSALEIIHGLFPEKNHDFIVSIDENNSVLVKSIDSSTTSEDIKNLARTIIDTISSEAMVKAVVGVGTVAPTVREIAKSYKEAQVALEVGKVFDTEKSIVSYENLGIGRLIYQLPTTLCELFLSEVFKKDSIDSLNSETMYTIQKFFENNLNVSETSRQLYVHRNTLVYRLDKVQKITGLDLRIFEHAVIFKVAIMVKKYLTSNPIKI